MLRTRPGFPRLICLPSTFWYGAYLYACADVANGEGVSTHAFASGLLQAYIAVAPSWDGEALAKTLAIGYPSPPSGWVWDLLIIARACYNDLTLKNVCRARHTTNGSDCGSLHSHNLTLFVMFCLGAP